MIDKDQQLLWESYVESKRPDYPDVDGDNDRKESMKKAFQDKKDKSEDDDEQVDEDAEGMSNMEFSAIGRENPEQAIFNAVVSWMKADTEGLMTPEDFEGYSMSDAFDDAKEFIRDALQDISFSEVKSHMSGTMSLHDPEEASFEASVDADIRQDDSRLSDMPPREPGV
jgi:hypothetical protein